MIYTMCYDCNNHCIWIQHWWYLLYFLLKLSIINISYDKARVVGRGFKNILEIVIHTVYTHILYNTRLQEVHVQNDYNYDYKYNCLNLSTPI